MQDKYAHALTYGAVVELKAALDRADSPGDFLAEADAIIDHPDNLLELPFNTGDPDPLVAGDQRSVGRDINNSLMVYEFLGALDPANASDRRLWTYLAFGTYRSYMQERWPLDPEQKWRQRVETRWLMLNANRGRLVRHGISRLWWVASLTYDPKCEHPLSLASGDPFAYTGAVLQNEDRVNALFDREAGAIPALVRAVLEHAAENNTNATDNHIRALMKEITLVYGYRDIEILEPAAIQTLVGSLASH